MPECIGIQSDKMEFENIGGPFNPANQPSRRRHHQILREQRRGAAETQHGPTPQEFLDRLTIKKGGRALDKVTSHVHQDIYYNDYLRATGKGVADELHKRHTNWVAANPPPPPAPFKWKPSQENLEHPAIQEIHGDYHRKGVRPPIQVQLNAYKAAGYPESWLIRLLKNHDKRVKEQPEMDAWFDLVMGPYGKKKETVPKPRTLRQIFKIKAIKVVMPDDEDAPPVDDE